MTALQACQYVVENGVSLIRPRKETPGQYDIKPFYVGGRKKGFVYLDIMSAQAVVTVYNGLNEQNKQKYAALDISRLLRIAWQLVKIGGSS